MELTQSQLANATGITQQAISLWELDKTTPKLEHCEILADFCGINLDEFVGRI